MKIHATDPWINFWRELKIGYDFFEQRKVPPNVEVKNKKYTFSELLPVT